MLRLQAVNASQTRPARARTTGTTHWIDKKWRDFCEPWVSQRISNSPHSGFAMIDLVYDINNCYYTRVEWASDGLTRAFHCPAHRNQTRRLLGREPARIEPLQINMFLLLGNLIVWAKD